MADEQPGAFRREMIKGLWAENPVFVLVLGLCPSLAVTNSVINGVVMGIASTFVLIGSSWMISSLRKAIPGAVRITSYIVIIATFVTVAENILQAYLPVVHKQLGAFIALIVVNCIILGRAEAFANRNTPLLSIADAIGMGFGFTLVLTVIGAIREVLGNGTFAGVVVLGEGFEPWVVMKLPPGGFLALGAVLIVIAWTRERFARRPTASSAHGGAA